MEKFIELLNEYAYGENKELYWRDAEMVDLNYEIVISKKFGFIKWLVDNDKIDLGELIMIKDKEQKAIVDIDNSRENTLLMLLSISDTPIDDLISYLK